MNKVKHTNFRSLEPKSQKAKVTDLTPKKKKRKLVDTQNDDTPNCYTGVYVAEYPKGYKPFGFISG